MSTTKWALRSEPREVSDAAPPRPDAGAAPPLLEIEDLRTHIRMRHSTARTVESPAAASR